VALSTFLITANFILRFRSSDYKRKSGIGVKKSVDRSEIFLSYYRKLNPYYNSGYQVRSEERVR
jgi:hypothetical protein